MPGGLFWTIPVTDDVVKVDLKAGTASIHLTNSMLRDFTTTPLDLMHAPSIPATVSALDVTWTGKPSTLAPVCSSPSGFVAGLMQASATASWSFNEAGFQWTSDAASTSKSEFAELGQERNGSFLGSAGDVNGNGRIDIGDAVLALRIVEGTLTPTDPQLKAADILASGKVTVDDVRAILRCAIGL